MKTNRQLIKDHDIIYLLHTKDDKYLSPSNFNDSIILNKRIEAADPENIFDGLWEIEERPESQEEGENLGRSKIPNKKSAANLLSATYNPNMSMNMSFRKTSQIKK